MQPNAEAQLYTVQLALRSGSLLEGGRYEYA